MPTLNHALLLETPKALGATKATIQGMRSNMTEMGNQQPTLVELGWLAGLIDGEGYIGICRNNDYRNKVAYVGYIPMMHVCNTDEAIILKARDIMRKMGLNPYIRAAKTYNKKSKDNYRVQVKHMNKLINLLSPILPYLTGHNQERAKLVVEFCESRLDQKALSVRESKRINNNHHSATFKPKPYTERQLAIIEQVGKLTARGGSETTRMAARLKSEIRKIKAVRKVLSFGQPSRAEGIVHLSTKVGR